MGYIFELSRKGDYHHQIILDLVKRRLGLDLEIKVFYSREKPDLEINSWSNCHKANVSYNGNSFSLAEFPFNCSWLVFGNFGGLTRKNLLLALEIAEITASYLEYPVLLCSITVDETYVIDVLLEKGFLPLLKNRNLHSGNTVVMFYKDIKKDDSLELLPSVDTVLEELEPFREGTPEEEEYKEEDEEYDEDDDLP